jgi:hypothetical protein
MNDYIGIDVLCGYFVNTAATKWYATVKLVANSVPNRNLDGIFIDLPYEVSART